MSVVKRWCPTPWAPMAAGDGLLLRVRPPLGALSAGQVVAIAEAARTFGNGAIDLTNRANLQLRGFDESGWRNALERLIAASLVDPDPAHDTRPALLVVPEWRHGDDSHRIATALLDRIGELPPLPPKIGIAIDAGAEPMLGDVSADFRIERGQSGQLILRADGRATGVTLTEGLESDALIDFVRWFAASGGRDAGRMRRHHAVLPDWSTGNAHPAVGLPELGLGPHPFGSVIGLPFGRIGADDLGALTDLPGFTGLRLTPWRKLIVEGVSAASPGLPAVDADLLRVDACAGAPACAQASVETRTLAVRVARHVAGHLHVSGCSKGCACMRPTETVLTGRNGRFDVGHDARAGDRPAIADLTPGEILAHFEGRAVAL